MKHTILITVCLLVLGACAQPEYRAAVATFGAVAETAATAQGERLEALTAHQQGDIMADLAKRRVQLSYASGCALLAVPSGDPDACFVVGPDGNPITTPLTFKGIEALNGAMAQYAQSLNALAADSKEDATAFNAALLELATSADELIAAVQDAQGPTENAAGLQSAATISGTLANAAFAAVRASKLRAIIIEMDPTIQQAVQLLALSSEAFTGFEVAGSVDRLEAARTRLDAAIRGGAKQETVAMHQAALIDEVAAAKRIAKIGDPYAKIAKAHADLAATSGAGISSADQYASLRELLALARVLKAEADNS